MNANKEMMKELALTMLTVAHEIKDLQSRGIDQVTALILDYCHTHEAVRASDIAAVLEVNPSSITRRIQALEQDGVIRLTKDPADQRSVLISVTSDGKRLLDTLTEQATHLFSSIIGHWDADDIQDITNLMSRFSNELTSWKAKYPISDKKAHRRKIIQSWKTEKP
ncbi:MarR family transcriptional regulator [Paenibacillus sp. D2_2]|uniref:MarR family winged helix-turn-helix transcriptional regulator n=1 Tax=Paenibacillus sp. D2_2 TaxID=3073092 RepID=UPI002814FE61|nr:MarR family transcriptional regulator [Paenibacillus sp. D2_2]WMT40961.1 MarR family transcriptional regulator [Paenibacillus sp. D2_2]